jgi:hypothetical protein
MGSMAGICYRLESFCTASDENDIRAALVEPNKIPLLGNWKPLELTLAKSMAVAFMDGMRDKTKFSVEKFNFLRLLSHYWRRSPVPFVQVSALR